MCDRTSYKIPISEDIKERKITIPGDNILDIYLIDYGSLDDGNVGVILEVNGRQVSLNNADLIEERETIYPMQDFTYHFMGEDVEERDGEFYFTFSILRCRNVY
ncbi:Hypothetical protein BQ3484_399 [Cedratvirus A11]|uniref:Uncharacterized protein n=1 Tax=Cedratvirus A11 TaxID=1903266 RepID=A0A1M7XUY3_9VIRU|nr:Hypothetical protein BQ3484_399 [Cedratvirus A11]SHO33467.1 Hypothetical protein BQ3484_399 [Cedratvirus A11]